MSEFSELLVGETLVEEDEKKVKVLELKIGENETSTNSLIAMEMQDSQKTGYRNYRKQAIRKKSIDKIFGKMNTIEIEDNVDKKPLKHLPRRSLIALDPSIMKPELQESDSDH